MRIAVTYGPMCLQRSPEATFADPRTGSELGWVRIVEGLRELGHDVVVPALGTPEPDDPWDVPDVAISINEPYTLRSYPEAKLRICMFWLNEFTFCREGQYASKDWDDVTDLYFSPSEAHRQKAIGDWGAPRPEKWMVNRLGCDELDRDGINRIPGRLVYCSSPDRGLHRVLEAWPSIRRAVPHATLRIFYNVNHWVRSFDTTPYWSPIERLRTRALYVEEALKRLSGPEWGIEVVDQVSHAELMREMAAAEVLVHPCETTSWSEGFSCTVLEGCAAEACPIVSDCDALGEVYAGLEPFKVGDWAAFRERTIRALTDSAFRSEMNAKAKALADRLSWKAHVARLDEVILGRVKS